jgi:hypothetical protein
MVITALPDQSVHTKRNVQKAKFGNPCGLGPEVTHVGLAIQVVIVSKAWWSVVNLVCIVILAHLLNSTWHVLLVLIQQMVTRVLLVLLVQVVMHALKKACLRAIFTNVQQATSAQLDQPALNLKEFQGLISMICISAIRLFILFKTIRWVTISIATKAFVLKDTTAKLERLFLLFVHQAHLI